MWELATRPHALATRSSDEGSARPYELEPHSTWGRARVDAAAVRELVAKRTGLPAGLLRLYVEGRPLVGSVELAKGLAVHARLRGLRGGAEVIVWPYKGPDGDLEEEQRAEVGAALVHDFTGGGTLCGQPRSGYLLIERGSSWRQARRSAVSAPECE